jgi:hypothetical protein
VCGLCFYNGNLLFFYARFVEMLHQDFATETQFISQRGEDYQEKVGGVTGDIALDEEVAGSIVVDCAFFVDEFAD